MTNKRTAVGFRKLWVFAGAAFLAGSVLIVPEAVGGRRGRGSVRHSSASRNEWRDRSKLCLVLLRLVPRVSRLGGYG